MKHEHWVRSALLIVLVSLGIRAMAEDFKPGVQHICVPNAARDGWDCGTVDDPPKPAVVEEPTREEPAPAPPPFLADPTRPRSATNYRAEPPATQPEPEAPVETAPIVEAEVVPESPPVDETAPEPLPATVIEDAPVAETVPDAVPGTMESQPLPEPAIVEAESLPELQPAPAPTLATPEPTPATPEPAEALPAENIVEQAPEPSVETVLETAAEPEPTPEPVVTHTSAAPETSEPVTVEAMPEPEAESASEPVTETSAQSPPAVQPESAPTPDSTARSVARAPAPQASSGKLYLASLQGARAFGKLPPAHFTLQLAHASSAEGFPELIQQMGIDFRQCYVLRVRRDGGDWWVLAYGSFEDVNAAKAALVDVRPAPGMTAVWPRRIGYLQGEYQP